MSTSAGQVMTGRRRCYLAHCTPLHNMSAEEATAKFSQEAGNRTLWRAGGGSPN